MKPHRTQSGFTIVELLIVIVIIGILAAITIVAYNGIQNRAKTSAVTSSLASAAKQLELANVSNGAYPGDSSGLQKATDINYEYTSAGDTYCLTATKDTVSYKIQNTNTTPVQGGCAGHGQGGVPATTNLVTNPGFETNTTGWGTMNCSSQNRDTTIFHTGTSSYKCVSNSTVVSFFTGPATAVAVGENHTMSAYVRSDQPRQIEIYISALDGSGAEIQRINSTYTTLSANTWTRVSASGTIPANAVNAKVQLNFRSPLVGQQDWVDSIMYTKSAQLATYADGNSPNWVWNGTANNATSTGPAS